MAFATLALPCAACEVDPLKRPKCGAVMRIIALIDDAAVIERSFRHLNAWDPGPAFFSSRQLAQNSSICENQAQSVMLKIIYEISILVAR